MKIELTADVLEDLQLLLKYIGRGECPTPEKCQPGDQCDICKAEAILRVLDKARSELLTTQAKDRIKADWDRIKGKVAVLHPGVDVMGHKDDDDFDSTLDTPAIVQFHDSAYDQSMLHWNDDHLNSIWNIELLQPHPQLSELKGLWIDGQSYLICATKIEPQPHPAISLVDQIPLTFQVDYTGAEVSAMAGASELAEGDVKALKNAGFKTNNSGETERFPVGNWGEGISRREVVRSVRIAGTLKSVWVALVEELDPTGKMTYQKDGGGDEDGTIAGAIEWLERNRQECRKLS